MDPGALSALLACPRCGGTLDAHLRCDDCGTGYSTVNGIADLRGSESSASRQVRCFYEAAPFPGYPPADNLSTLRARAERSVFMKRLDRELAGDARIVEIGCGTGQTSLYLAHGDRMVVGADISHASLQLAAAAAQRFGLENARFIQADLLQPALRKSSFDLVYCSGVLHHTADPRASFGRIAQLALPGGLIIIGLYNRYARIPLMLRRCIARATRYGFIPDPVLAERKHEPERYRAWLLDQYRHPLEHSHTVAEAQQWFRENGIEYLRCFPSALLGADDEDLLQPAADDWPIESVLSQLAWMASIGHEGGLFMMIGRRTAAQPNRDC